MRGDRESGLGTRFDVTGLFYQEDGYKFRRYLDIRRVGSAKRKPALMAVLMNPGSSYPLDGIDGNPEPSPAVADDTQRQIMKVMRAASIDCVRILNLSDLRTPDSSVFYEFVKSEESRCVRHSIFASERRSDLRELFVKGVPVVFGWGVHPALVPLAAQAVESLGIENPLGIQKTGCDYAYYHPLPRIYSRQLEWVKQITDQLAARLPAVYKCP